MKKILTILYWTFVGIAVLLLAGFLLIPVACPQKPAGVAPAPGKRIMSDREKAEWESLTPEQKAIVGEIEAISKAVGKRSPLMLTRKPGLREQIDALNKSPQAPQTTKKEEN